MSWKTLSALAFALILAACFGCQAEKEKPIPPDDPSNGPPGMRDNS